MYTEEPDQHELTTLVAARYPIILIESYEETRLLQVLERASHVAGWPLFRWNCTDGIERLGGERERMSDTYALTDALRQLYKSPQNGVFVWLDAHPFLDEPLNVRLIKNLVQSGCDVQRTLIFVSHALTMPPELRPYTTHYSMTLPDQAALRAVLVEEAQLWSRGNGERKVRGDPEVVNQMLRLLIGLTREDARRILRQAIEDDGAITDADLQRAQTVKNELLNQGRLLELQRDQGSVSVGGLKNLKRWLDLRRAAFFGEAGDLDIPKGVLLTGVQGCGKSLAARALARHWALPLLRLDFGVLYNMYHGETERNLRQALKTAEAMAPCVLWFDEIEKGLATGDDASDGGLSKRVLGTLLTWMGERNSRVFVLATANDISGLPPELVRKGRFDEVFFVDLPSADERAEILRIHLAARQLDAQTLPLAELVHSTAGFSGAEIEQAIVGARYAAHAAKQPFAIEHLQQEIQRTRPLSVLMAERLAALRAWAQQRAVMAN